MSVVSLTPRLVSSRRALENRDKLSVYQQPTTNLALISLHQQFNSFALLIKVRPACKMQDPSQGIQRELLPHVHLVSAYRFPHLPSLPPGKVSEWLLGAPKIARGQSPFYWTYLDRPVDGTILLVWQSMALGSEFPSDGYVWSPTETAFQLEVEGGYTLEMYHQKVGYAPGEPVATHSRRRYRLMPSKFPNSSVEPDLSLWIVHYGQCDPNDRVPSNVIPIDIRVQNTMQTRAYLQQQGQIVQKEFMLHDRANWPQISFPRNQPRGGPMYHANQPPSRIPQSMAYPPQHGSVGPPSKRARTQQAPPNAATGSAGAVMDADDQEDTTIGDVFDFITPRDVSLLRYKHNHEWMEEVLSSPYSIHQIIPADLGLGLRGELASLTDGFFDAPFDPSKHPEIEKSYIGRLDHGKADEFRKRTEERVEQLKKDVEKMEAKHKKRMAKFKKGSLLLEAEKELRTAVADPSDTGPEYWRLEGKIDIDDEEDGKVVSKVPSKVADILAEVEASLGRTAAAVREIRRIQDGGFEEPAPVPVAVPSPQKPQQPSLVGTPQGSAVGNDMDIGNSAAGLLDQYHGISSNATPLSNFGPSPQPHLQAHSTSGTPGIPSPSPQPVAHISPQPQIPAQDVNMSGTTEEASTDATGTGDWIVVPSGGVSPTAAEASTTEPSTISVSASAVAAKSPHPIGTENSTPLPDFSASPNDFADLADLDTAGDALAGYGDDMVHDGDLGLDIAMDDSAFGEAFHGVELREDGDDTGDGI
jgi:hypothetical protein